MDLIYAMFAFFAVLTLYGSEQPSRLALTDSNILKEERKEKEKHEWRE